MSMNDIHEGIKELKERLEEKLHHPYVMRYIDIPFVDEDKLLLLYSVLHYANLPVDEIKHYALTIMLVQIALDTHEKVSQSTEAADFHKKRQLTALAGDYYSGLYYYLLAEQRDISLIRVLAAGIEEINEEKVALHQKEKRTAIDVLNSLSIIESALLQKTCDHFGVLLWKPFVSKVSVFKRIEREWALQKDRMTDAPFLKILSAKEAEVEYEACIQEMKKEIYDLAQGNDSLIKTIKLLNI